jgi:hypothetical protein
MRYRAALLRPVVTNPRNEVLAALHDQLLSGEDRFAEVVLWLALE